MIFIDLCFDDLMSSFDSYNFLVTKGEQRKNNYHFLLNFIEPKHRPLSKHVQLASLSIFFFVDFWNNLFTKKFQNPSDLRSKL